MSSFDTNNQPQFVVTNTIIVRNIADSVAFYRDVLGATVLREGEPTFLRLSNVWLTINGGGGGTDDKPDVVAAPPKDANALSLFINLRVVDIAQCYRDPDGYLIEVGQTTMTPGPLDLYT
jgi:predicted enzyme related to lactoylglutathione lyase